MPWFASIDFQSYSNFCSSYVWRDRSINFNSNFPKTSQSINTSLRFKFTYILQFHLFTSCACTNWWLSHSQDWIRFNNSLASREIWSEVKGWGGVFLFKHCQRHIEPSLVEYFCRMSCSSKINNSQKIMVYSINKIPFFLRFFAPSARIMIYSIHNQKSKLFSCNIPCSCHWREIFDFLNKYHRTILYTWYHLSVVLID